MRSVIVTLARLTVAAALVAAATVGCGPADPEAAAPTGATRLTDTPRPDDASDSPTPDPDASTSSPGPVKGQVTQTPEPHPSTSTPSADPTSRPPSDRTRTLTPADDGTTVRLRVGEVVELHLADSFAPEPDVQGDAIEVAETVSASGSSGREFEVRAIRVGDATLTGESDGEAFSIRFHVEA